MKAAPPRPPLAGVVLCGGRSTRMGRDKAVLDFHGEPLVVRAARRLGAVANPVFLAPGEPGRLAGLGLTEVADEVPSAGPLAGLAAGLAAAPHHLLAAVAVDMPFASPPVFALLASLHAGEDAVVPVTARGPEPLHAVYATTALPAIRAALADGRLAVRDALESVTVRNVGEDEWRRVDMEGRFALNLNRPEDLAALLG